jgi:hypothetical protein
MPWWSGPSGEAMTTHIALVCLGAIVGCVVGLALGAWLAIDVVEACASARTGMNR